MERYSVWIRFERGANIGGPEIDVGSGIEVAATTTGCEDGNYCHASPAFGYG